ncbi:flagellum-associated coiled-coil domain-containing protein 1-like isoform X2 [Mya arenaria]|uniref:flagellum-associated coiled-coil domain-containing protein 1-like isoform X2 n=1 Tax=Mya arenaria TaxID=6604 RepID=UPI0022E66E7A|nr:flagellum-associated coiled-coil domain-containing protein 1-like isoform X2 [Mya arenaria]
MMTKIRWFYTTDGIIYRVSTPAHATRPTSYGHVTYMPPGTATTDGSHNGFSANRIRRPKTAAAILGITRDCDRVAQLEHEPTRRHNLENHMPVKKAKPPPWQAKIDPPLVPFVVGPGYILSKSKTKYAVTLKDELFDPPIDEEKKNKKVDHEREGLISDLQNRISDLTLYLEEERLNHKQTKQKAEEFLKDKVDELENAKKQAVAEKEREWKDELENVRSQLETEHSSYKATAEGQITRMKKEIEFLQGAFDSYKSSLHQETSDKWARKQEDLTTELEQKKNQEIQEIKQKFLQEKNLEKAQYSREHHRALENLRKEHKRELDSILRKYSDHAADKERLEKCTLELEETKKELAEVQQSYNQTCQQLTNVTRTLTDMKMRLLAFEEQFDLKVQEVDEKYQDRINELLTEKTELKRLYRAKCEEIYEEKVMYEKDRVQRVMTAKETMNKMLQSKHKANVNLAPSMKETQERKRTPKVRPGSAPITKGETETASLSAGETEHLRHAQEEYVRPEVFLPEDTEEIQKLREELMADVRSKPMDDSISNTVS